MSKDYWQKQSDQPLFPDILWSRPENKGGAGKLAIVGGNINAFGAPGIAYNTALESGAGVVRVVLPIAVKKTVKYMLPDADYAASTPSGSFAKKSLDEIMQTASWSEMTLLAGDIGRNSETATLLESFVQKYDGLLTITQDAADFFIETPSLIIDRPNTCIVISLAQLQRIFITTPSITPIVYSMSAVALAEALHEYTTEHRATIVTLHNELVYIAQNGVVTTTKTASNPPDDNWRVKTAATASVWWMQNPNKPLEAITTAIHEELV